VFETVIVYPLIPFVGAVISVTIKSLTWTAETTLEVVELTVAAVAEPHNKNAEKNTIVIMIILFFKRTTRIISVLYFYLFHEISGFYIAITITVIFANNIISETYPSTYFR